MAQPTSFGIHKNRGIISELGTLNGGKGSGNFGHSGRPGKVGGSGKGNGPVQSIPESDYLMSDEFAGFAKEALTGDGGANSSLDDWAKENIGFPEDLAGSGLSFDEVLQSMADGKDFYDTIGHVDSADREIIFDEMAKRTGLDYNDIYEVWLHGLDENGLPSDNRNYKGMRDAQENVSYYLDGGGKYYRELKQDYDSLTSGKLAKEARTEMEKAVDSTKDEVTSASLLANGVKNRVEAVEESLQRAYQLVMKSPKVKIGKLQEAISELINAQGETTRLEKMSDELKGATRAYATILGQQVYKLATEMKMEQDGRG